MKNKTCVVSGLALAMMVTSVQAETRIGAGYVVSQYEFSEIDDGSGFSLSAGHHFDRLPLLLEVTYLNLKDAKPKGADIGLGFNGAKATIGYETPFSPGSSSSSWIKGGGFAGDARINEGTFGLAKESNGFVLGVGADFLLRQGFGLRLAAERMFSVRDFVGSLQSKSDIDLLSVSLIFSIGEHSPPTQSRDNDGAAISPLPPPPVTAAAPPINETPAPVPEPEPPPPPPHAPKHAAGETALAMPNATLRSRPAADGQSMATLESGASVVLKSDVRNITGVWWYVEASGQRGWLKETDLQPKLP